MLQTTAEGRVGHVWWQAAVRTTCLVSLYARSVAVASALPGGVPVNCVTTSTATALKGLLRYQKTDNNMYILLLQAQRQRLLVI